MMNPPYDGDDIWGFSAHDTEQGHEMPDLRLSSSTGFFMPSVSDHFLPAEVMETDFRASTSLLTSNPTYIKPEIKTEYEDVGIPMQVVAMETFGALPPSNKKKRRREHDQVMEATIQYGSGTGPQYTTPQSSSSSSSHHSPGDPSYGHHSLPQIGQDDYFFPDAIPDQQLTPVLPVDHILPLCQEFAQVREEVIALRAHQYRILKHEKSRVMELKETIRQLSARLQAIDDALNSIKCEALLHTSDINRMFWLQPDLQICRTQLELYMNEINHTLSPNEAWKCTELVLEEHPFPISLKQKENVPKVVVRLLTGACATITHVSAVEARVVSTSQGSPKPPEIINCTEKMKLTPYHREHPDANGPTDMGYTVVFEQLNFLTGTRMRDFCLQFSCKVSLGPGKSELSETAPTPPFVVYTNGNQWNDIEGILLRWEAFGGGSTAIWCRLANSLQRRYMLATMQNPNDPQRPLSRGDFNFLYQTKIDPKTVPSPETVINEKQYLELWNWLGEGLHRLHVNSKLLKCWTSGYIIGFISRENARAVLINRARGTFIVRFSESSPGRLAVSFAISEYSNIEVGNYLMGPEEARSLPDTVRDYSNLTAVVRVIEPGMENPTYAASSKDTTFGTMYSKIHPGQNTISGYMKTMVSNGR